MTVLTKSPEPDFGLGPDRLIGPQSALADIAACTDPYQLHSLVTPDISPELQAVLLANAHTELLSRVSIKQFQAMQDFEADPNPITRLRRNAFARLPSVVRVSNLGNLGEILDAMEVSSVLIDEIIDVVMGEDCSWFAEPVVLGILGISGTDLFHTAVWEKSTYSAVNIVQRLDQAHWGVLLAEVLSRITDPASRIKRGGCVDKGFVELCISALEPDVLATAMIVDSLPRDIFTDEAIELLLDTPGWSKLLWYQKLSTDQLGHFAKLVDPDRYPELALLVDRNADSAQMVLGLVSEETEFTYEEATALRNCMYRGKDEAFWELLEHTSPDSTLEYLLGTWAFDDPVLLPDISEVPALVTKVESIMGDLERYFLCVVGSMEYYGNHLSYEYKCALADQVPGALSGLSKDTDICEYTCARLTATGAAPEMIQDQLWATPLLTLHHVEEVLRAFVRATAN